MPQLTVTDQMGNPVTLNSPPQRIISLVPSQTELLYSLGLDRQVVGITKFCIHPSHWLVKKQIIGGTKHFDFNTIDKLRPDFILGNKEENYLEGILELKKRFPVWMSDIVNLDDALEMIRSVGIMMEASQRSNEISSAIQEEFNRLERRQNIRVLYLIWKKPWMAVGKRTFIDDMLTRNGFENVITSERYPTITTDEMQSLNPEVIFLSSEPFPFNETHQTELKSILPGTRSILVDGEMFSWYGSRLMQACHYFRKLPI